VIDMLGGAIHARVGADRLDVPVSDVQLYGRGEPLPEVPETVLLCVDGLVFGRGEWPVTAALVVREQDVPEGVVEEADHRGPPILVLSRSIPWQHALQMLTTAVSSAPGGSTGATGDLFGLADTLAAVLGGAVAIEDVTRQVLAYSSLPEQPIDEVRRAGILGRRVPQQTLADEKYARVYRSSGVIRFPSDPDSGARVVVAVRSGSEVLGSIWAIDHGAVDAAGEKALLSGSRLAALHLLQLRDGAELERRTRAQLLRELLGGRTMPSVVAARLGLHAASPVTLLGIPVDRAVRSGGGENASAVADLARVLTASVAPAVVVLEELGSVYLLVSAPETSRRWLRRLAEEIVLQCRSALRLDVGIAVGPSVQGLADLGRSRTDVDLVLPIVAPGTTALVEDVRAQMALLQLATVVAGDERLRLPAVDDLLAGDDSSIPYAQTLLTYLDAGGDVARAAAGLHVHENTLRYRLRRLQERFGIDLDDPDTRLVTWLQLRTAVSRAVP
jgi:hypothetical protein